MTADRSNVIRRGECWNEVGQAEAGADAACRWLGASDPGGLQAMHEGWLQVQAFLAAAEPEPAP